MLKQIVSARSRRSLPTALLALVILSGAVGARILWYSFDPSSPSPDWSADIPYPATWQLKVQAPTVGLIRGVFINDQHTDWCGGVDNIYDGDVRCGLPCSRVAGGWNFELHAEVTQGTATGWAWADEPTQTFCKDIQEGPGGE